MKKLLKNKKIIAGIVVIIVIIIGVFAYMQMNASVLVLKADTVNVEYGESISTDAIDYLNVEKVNQDIIDVTSVTVDNNSDDYPAVGEYTVTLTYKDETATVTVIVSDTTSPEFKDFDEEIEYIKDCGPEDLSSEFEATDLSEVTISADESNVDYSKTGEYNATIAASDEYGNEITKETTIKIIDPTIKLDPTSKTITVDDSFTVKATITGKDDEATFKSSDTSVATVDDNGKVTGKKAGSATITASANDVEATCKVTVEKKTTNSESTSSTGNGSSSTSSSNSSSSSSSSSNTMTVRTDLASEIVSLTNKQRTNNGLSSLSVNSTLTAAAQARAKEIATSFSHTRPDGTSCFTILSEYGYYGYVSAGENISHNSGGASSCMEMWMNSSSHRANILNENYTEIGVGVVSYKGTNYYVQIFTCS